MPLEPLPSLAPIVSVIVVNWNGGNNLAECLTALKNQTFCSFELIVVDNGSTDGSAELVVSLCPEARLIRLPENVGYAAGNNVGAASARGTWLALLNNDAFPEPMWLAALLDASRRYPDVCGFGSLQLQALTPEVMDGVGDAYHVFGLPWRTGHRQRLTQNWTVEREIFAPCGAAALYRGTIPGTGPLGRQPGAATLQLPAPGQRQLRLTFLDKPRLSLYYLI